MLTGYSSLIRFDGTEADFGFDLELDPALEVEGLAPGASGMARLSFWAVGALPTLMPGQKFELREGTRVVGHGLVIDPNLP